MFARTICLPPKVVIVTGLSSRCCNHNMRTKLAKTQQYIKGVLSTFALSFPLCMSGVKCYFTNSILSTVCECLCELRDVFQQASWSYFLPLIQKRQKISRGTREVKAKSECSLYLVCSISRIVKMSHSVVRQCCFALAVLSLMRVGDGSGGCSTSPGEKRFSAQDGNPQIKGKLPAGAFFRLDWYVAISACLARWD